MKKLKFSHKTLLGVALLGSFVAMPLATSIAQAAPPSYAADQGFCDKDKKNKKDKRNKGKKHDRDRYDRDDRDRYDRDNRGNNRNTVTYAGVVSAVRAGNRFDVRAANGRTYNVHTSSNVPRALNQGDRVRVYGRLSGDNDIRNASVSILNNGRDNNYGNSNNQQGYSGVVSEIRNSREFDIRIGNKTYNVYAASSTPRLSKNDTVLVYGQGYGDNDIRNARVTITRRGGNNGNATYGSYQNFSGVVTDMKSDREFNVRINGRTYNVFASSATRNLNRGDEVRIYGRSYGDNDIRNANVVITRNR